MAQAAPKGDASDADDGAADDDDHEGPTLGKITIATAPDVSWRIGGCCIAPCLGRMRAGFVVAVAVCWRGHRHLAPLTTQPLALSDDETKQNTKYQGTSRTILELPDDAAAGGTGGGDAKKLPRRYALQPATDAPAMSVLSAEAPAGGGALFGAPSSTGASAADPLPEPPRLKRPRLDGVVSQRYDAAPMMRPAGAAAGAVPAAAAAAAGGGGGGPAAAAAALGDDYRRLARARTEAAKNRGRGVALIDDDRAAVRLYQGQHHRGQLYVKSTQADREALEAAAVSARELRARAQGPKRVRMERAELERLLFRLFERQPAWSLQALQRETDQPPMFLRDVLADVAARSVRGPNRDLWELLPQFRTAAPGGAGGAGAGGAAGGGGAGGSGADGGGGGGGGA